MADIIRQDKESLEKSSVREGSPVVNLSIESGTTQDLSDSVDPKVRRKIDLHIMPLLAVLYLLSFLDRGNIGNAAIAGMINDLKLTGNKYQLCAAVFFIPYSLMEIPSNVVLKLLRPSVWISSLIFAWGIVMISMAFVKSFQGLLAARIFLGLAESGFAPGIAFYITLWYCRADQARPLALYFSAATVAGAFGGLFAFALEKANGAGGRPGWAWIFLVTGLITVAFAPIAFCLMPDYPHNAKFLNSQEKKHLVAVLQRDTHNERSHFEMRFIWEVLRSPIAWLHALTYIGMVMPLYSISIFLPTIIKAYGFSASESQLLSIPPYALACMCTIVLGMVSDRFQKRGPFIMGCALLAIVGYIMLYTTSPTSHREVGYAGTILIACGLYPTVPLMLAWGAGNVGCQVKKAVIIALMSGIGNLGGVCSSFMYRTKDSPRYHLGHSIVIGFLSMAFLSAASLIYIYRKLNRAKEEQCAQEDIQLSSTSQLAQGCNSPSFRYLV